MNNNNNIIYNNKWAEKDNGEYRLCGQENDHLTANSIYVNCALDNT